MQNNICVNCGKPAIELHHIVPLALGGNDIDSNKVYLCSECHALVHGHDKIRRGTDWHELQAVGITNAHKNGIKFGRPRAKKPNNWDEVIAKWNNKEIPTVKAMKELKLSKATFYKYVKSGVWDNDE